MTAQPLPAPTSEPRILPRDNDIEEVVLGACILYGGQAIAEVCDILLPETFFFKKHVAIWEAISTMFGKGEPVDILTLWHKLKGKDIIDGPYELTYLTRRTASAAHIVRHARILAELHITRATIEENQAKAKQAFDPLFDVFADTADTGGKVRELIDHYTKRGALSYHDAEAEELQVMDERSDHFIPSGWAKLDAVTGGFGSGDLSILAARPAMGKTATMISLAKSVARAGVPTLLISLELSQYILQSRMFAGDTGIPAAAVTSGRMTPEQVQARHAHLNDIKDIPLYLRYASALNLADIRAEVIRAKRSHGVRLVLIDQLNWITPPKGATTNERVGHITRAIKILAKQEGAHICLLHQLSRSVESRGGDKKPMLSDLRDSGNVEQDAQLVMFLHRPAYYGSSATDGFDATNLLNIIVAKNTNGSTGDAQMYFDPPTVSVHEYSPAWRNDYNDTNPF